jgi:hypothetical protein
MPGGIAARAAYWLWSSSYGVDDCGQDIGQARRTRKWCWVVGLQTLQSLEPCSGVVIGPFWLGAAEQVVSSQPGVSVSSGLVTGSLLAGSGLVGS